MVNPHAHQARAARLGDIASCAALLLLVLLPSVWLTKGVLEPFKATTEFLIAVLAWAALALLAASTGFTGAWRRHPLLALGGWGLVGCICLSAAVAYHPGVSWRYAALATTWVALGMVAWAWFAEAPWRRQVGMGLLAAALVWQSVLSLLQIARVQLVTPVGGWPLDFVSMLNVGALAGKPIGTLGNYNYLAEWLVLVTPPVAAWVAVQGRSGRILAGVSCAATMALLYGADSRAAWLGLVCGACIALTVLAWSRNSRWKLTGVVLALPLIGVALLNSPWQPWLSEPSVASRLASWRVAWQLWLAHPFLGVGLGGFKLQSVPILAEAQLAGFQLAAATERLLQVHNEPLQGLTELGLFGVTLAFGFLGGWSRLVAGNSTWPLVVRFGFLCGVWSLIIASCFGFPIHIPLTSLFLILIMGLGLATARQVGAQTLLSIRPTRQWAWVVSIAVAGMVVVTSDAWPNYRAHRLAYEADRHRQAGNWPAAEVAYRQADEGMRFKGRLRWFLLEALVRQGKYSEAVALFEASAKEGLGVDAYLWLGRALEGLDREGDAIAAYRRVTTFFPNNHPLHVLAQQRIDGLTSSARP